MIVDGTPTKEEVLEAYWASRKFLGLISEYVVAREGWDPEWISARDFDAYSDHVSFDPNGEVEIEWTVRDRCGDRLRLRSKTFPASHLWDSKAEALVKAEVAAREAARKAKATARLTSHAEEVEKTERELLAALRRKYNE